jgi:SPP1 family predicted phage head-tail adaptor
MAKTFSRPISIQRISDSTELWEDVYQVHASVNKAQDDSEYLRAGAIQAKRRLVFEIRYFPDLEAISFDTQHYRIIFAGVAYNVTSYDDYSLQHKTVKLLGESV